MTAHSEKHHTLASEGDSVDMFTFTPAINNNYQYNNPQPVHERLLKAGQYYKNKLNKRQDEVATQKQIEDELIVKDLRVKPRKPKKKNTMYRVDIADRLFDYK
jgi:hypothetical protein